MSPVSSYKKQQYRIYIHGYSHRHVFGTPDGKEVTEWLVKLFKGEQPGFNLGSYDWSVHTPNQWGDWSPISDASRKKLIAEVNRRLSS